MKKQINRIISLFAILSLIFASCVFSVVSADTAFAIKIACVGDSITDNNNSEKSTYNYPYQLQNILGSGYEVMNFGRSGSTMINNYSISYTTRTDSTSYADSLVSSPDIVLIMMGTNDSSKAFWDADKYYSSYCSLVNTYAALSSNPRIYIMTSPTGYDKGVWSNDQMNLARINGEVRDIAMRVASEKGCGIIDINTATDNHGDWFYDGIHPTETGAAAIANKISQVVTDTPQFTFSENFENYILSDTENTYPSTGGLISYISAGIENNVSNMYIKADTGGNKYLSIYGKASSSTTNEAKVNIGALNGKAAVVEMSARKHNTADNVNMLLGKPYNGTSAYHGFKFTNDGAIGIADQIKDYFSPSGSTRITVPGNIWHNIKLVYNPLSTGYYGVDAYEDGVYKLSYSTTINNVTAVMLGYINNTQSTDCYVDIDNINIYHVNTPKISASSVRNYTMDVNNHKLSFYFNKALNSTTVNDQNIVLTNGVTVVTTAGFYSSSENEYTMLIQEALHTDVSYTVTFDGVKDTNNLGIAGTYTFTTFGTEGFRYISSGLEELSESGSVVSPDISNITLSFSDNVDTATVSGITLKDMASNVYDIKSAVADGSSCTLSLYMLKEKTDYILTLPETVLSTGGSALVKETIAFTTGTLKTVDEDFEGFLLNSHPSAGGGLSYTSSNTAGSVSNMYIKADTDGNKYLQIYGSANSSKDNIAGVSLGSADGKSVVVEMSVRRPASSAVPISIGKPCKTSYVNAFKMNNDGSVAVADSVSYTTISTNRLTAAGFGWHNIKLVYKPLSTGYYSIDAYDNGVYKITVTTTLNNLTSIMLGCVYNNQVTDGYLDLDNIKVYCTDVPTILGTSLANNTLNINNDSFGTYFDRDMDSSTLNTANVVVKHGADVVPYAGSYDLYNKKYIIKFNEMLTSGETYTVTLDNVKSYDSIGLPPTSYSFTAVGKLYFVFDSSDLSAFKGVSTNTKSIALTFNYPVDASTVSGIKLMDIDGQYVKNLQYSVKGNVCTLSFEGLNYDTRYIVNMPATVKNTDGDSLIVWTIRFTTESQYYLNEDFEDYTVSETSDTHPDVGGTIRFTSGSQADNVSNMFIKAEDSGNKYLKIYAAAATRTENMAVVDVNVTGGKSIAIEMSVRIPNSNSVPKSIGKPYKGTSYINLLHINSDGSVATETNRITDAGYNWHNIKLVYTPNASTSFYNVDMYDEGVYKLTFPTAYDDITSVLLGAVYNNADVDGYLDLDNIKIYYIADKVSASNAYFTSQPNGEALPAIGDATTLYANVALVNNTLTDKTVLVIVAIYNTDDSIQQVCIEDHTVSLLSSEDICTSGITGIAGCSYAKIFVWDSMDSIYPVLKKPEMIN